MAINAEQLNIILAARDKEFTQAMERSQRRVERFAKQSQKNLGKTGRAFDALGSAARKLGPILAGVFTAQRVAQAADMAVQIGQLSQVANASTTEFQKFAAAARTVGIEQEKASDILKDMTDRVGDFLATGGGPMKDFFENVAPLVGVTAENFRGLSGPEALGLFVKTLEDAGASQQDFTFYLEAMASDATALLPLLKNNAQGLNQLGEQAAQAGRIMDQETITRMTELRNRSHELSEQMNVALSDALFNVTEELGTLAQWVEEYGAPALEKMIALAAAGASVFNTMADAYNALTGQGEIEGIVDMKTVNELTDQIGILRGERGRLQQEVGRLLDQLPEDLTNLTAYENETLRIIGSKNERIANLTQQIESSAYALEQAQKAIDATVDGTNGGSSMKIEVTSGRVTGNVPSTNLPRGLPSPPDIREATQELIIMGEAMDDLESIAGTLESGLEDVFMSALDGAESFQDTIKSTAAAVIRELYRVLVVQNLVNAAMGALGVSPAPTGGGGGRASGGPVQAGQPYTVGEHGRELFVPQTAGRILSVPQTKAAMSGGGEVTVVQNINVTTGVQQTVRAEILGLMPQIQEASKAAVLDARRRGGSFAGAF